MASRLGVKSFKFYKFARKNLNLQKNKSQSQKRISLAKSSNLAKKPSLCADTALR
ncbi:hypothetical protein CAMRE0001_0612 [Campylobacter rectus RM3267]|uniref:Uncharacterized protein n=1 Tax=Campylobacter rectus RM3267 TaxID=553218 RepID=B9D1F3_CAMRE|nr:hypothetical protein CAMRE0001_0612 [Campylobacter rectus RM3267]